MLLEYVEYTRRGNKSNAADVNEDALAVRTVSLPSSGIECVIFLAADGHGGPELSGELAQGALDTFAAVLKDAPEPDSRDAAEALKRVVMASSPGYLLMITTNTACRRGTKTF